MEIFESILRFFVFIVILNLEQISQWKYIWGLLKVSYHTFEINQNCGRKCKICQLNQGQISFG